MLWLSMSFIKNVCIGAFAPYVFHGVDNVYFSTCFYSGNRVSSV